MIRVCPSCFALYRALQDLDKVHAAFRQRLEGTTPPGLLLPSVPQELGAKHEKAKEQRVQARIPHVEQDTSPAVTPAAQGAARNFLETVAKDKMKDFTLGRRSRLGFLQPDADFAFETAQMSKYQLRDRNWPGP